MAVEITYFVHGTTSDNEKKVSDGNFLLNKLRFDIKSHPQSKRWVQNIEDDLVLPK